MPNEFVRYAKKAVLRVLRKNLSPIEYWQKRAQNYGEKAVLNISHPDEKINDVTEQQKREIFPYFHQCIRGNEKVILDFGCGTGRFTVDLATITGGSVIGIDPINMFLEMAPQHEHVEYKLMSEGIIPLPNSCVDCIWICLVLGGIKQKPLRKAISELMRVLKKDGLLFLVENTSSQQDTKNWFFRNIPEYLGMFPEITLVHLHDYFDLGERISLLAGRKVV